MWWNWKSTVVEKDSVPAPSLAWKAIRFIPTQHRHLGFGQEPPFAHLSGTQCLGVWIQWSFLRERWGQNPSSPTSRLKLDFDITLVAEISVCFPPDIWLSSLASKSPRKQATRCRLLMLSFNYSKSRNDLQRQTTTRYDFGFTFHSTLGMKYYQYP